jgi:basic amino acid/polyamine antiporter, APA family
MATDPVVTQSVGSAPLARRLGLITATALIVSEVIGVGIFLTPAEMVRSLGSPFWLIVVWLAMAAATVGGALCYGSLAARFPEAGGTYVYLREIFGKRTAFVYGWMALLVTDPGLTAMLAVGLAQYVGHLTDLGPWALRGVAAGAIIALAAVNALGGAPGARVLGALAVLKIGLLTFLVIWGFGLGRGDWANLAPFWTQRPGSDPLFSALGVALVGAFIAFAGWWDVSKISGEVRDPKRTMPRALILGVSIVTLVYVAVSVVFLYLVRPDRISNDNAAFAALAGDALFGRRGEVIFSLVVVISAAGSLSAVLMAAPRVYFAMARDGLFFAGFGAVAAHRDVPARATAVQATLAVALALTGTFGQIISYMMVPTLVFLVLTICGIFILERRRSPGEPSMAPAGYPLSPLLFLIPILTVIVLRIASDPVRSSIGLLVMLLGIPCASFVLSPRRSAAASDLDQQLNQTEVPKSTLDGPSAVPIVGTGSST